MGADRDRTVGERAAQAELEARSDIFGRPARPPVGACRLERGAEGAVRVLGTRPDVPLVQVRVQIDEAGPDLPAVLIDQGDVLRL
jgi:hypothetical protein